MPPLTSRMDAGEGHDGPGAAPAGIHLRCRLPAHPEAWLTLEAIRVEDSWSVFALSGLRTLAPASQAHLPVPWPIEWELQTPPGLVVPYMALSRESKGARLRYGFPLDGTRDTAPEATSAHSACRVRFVSSPQSPPTGDEDGIPGEGFFWPSPQAAVLLPEQDGPFLWLQEAQDPGDPFLDMTVDFFCLSYDWLLLNAGRLTQCLLCGEHRVRLGQLFCQTRCFPLIESQPTRARQLQEWARHRRAFLAIRPTKEEYDEALCPARRVAISPPCEARVAFQMWHLQWLLRGMRGGDAPDFPPSSPELDHRVVAAVKYLSRQRTSVSARFLRHNVLRGVWMALALRAARNSRGRSHWHRMVHLLRDRLGTSGQSGRTVGILSAARARADGLIAELRQRLSQAEAGKSSATDAFLELRRRYTETSHQCEAASQRWHELQTLVAEERQAVAHAQVTERCLRGWERLALQLGWWSQEDASRQMRERLGERLGTSCLPWLNNIRHCSPANRTLRLRRRQHAKNWTVVSGSVGNSLPGMSKCAHNGLPFFTIWGRCWATPCRKE